MCVREGGREGEGGPLQLISIYDFCMINPTVTKINSDDCKIGQMSIHETDSVKG